LNADDLRARTAERDGEEEIDGRRINDHRVRGESKLDRVSTYIDTHTVPPSWLEYTDGYLGNNIVIGVGKQAISAGRILADSVVQTTR
jgi:hypothetical protein